MDFFIKKNATLPLLVMRIIKDGRSDFHKYFESLSSTTIHFSMKNVDTQKFKIINAVCNTKKYSNGETDEYIIYYQFKNRDTNLVGRYEGDFKIQYNDGTIGLPLKDKVYINIVESFAANNITYPSNISTRINSVCCTKTVYIIPTPTPAPANDFNYLLISDNDLTGDNIPNNDININNIPTDDFINFYLLLPNNDLNGNNLPSNDLSGGNLPNNDLLGNNLPNNDLLGNNLPNDDLIEIILT